jgi:hypothetical protein
MTERQNEPKLRRQEEDGAVRRLAQEPLRMRVRVEKRLKLALQILSCAGNSPRRAHYTPSPSDQVVCRCVS